MLQVSLALSAASGSHSSRHLCVAGKLHFVKFETAKVEQVIEFIEAKGLLLPAAPHAAGVDQRVSIKATGGGAFKFTELFEARTAWLLASCPGPKPYMLQSRCMPKLCIIRRNHFLAMSSSIPCRRACSGESETCPQCHPFASLSRLGAGDDCVLVTSCARRSLALFWRRRTRWSAWWPAATSS